MGDVFLLREEFLEGDVDLVLLELVELKVVDNGVFSVLAKTGEGEDEVLLDAVGAIGGDGHAHPLAIGA